MKSTLTTLLALTFGILFPLPTLVGIVLLSLTALIYTTIKRSQ